jgi:hypothetical protein
MLPSYRQLRYFYLAFFSKPASYRRLYRFIHRQRVKRMLEIGIGTAGRAKKLIDLAAHTAGGDRIDYTGIDLFELRPADRLPGLSLKAAHRELSATGARVRLIPGDPFGALSRTANALTGTQLVLISGDQDRESLAKAWFYVPRMLSPGAQVFLEEPPDEHGQSSLRAIGPAELEQLASLPSRRRAA